MFTRRSRIKINGCSNETTPMTGIRKFTLVVFLPLLTNLAVRAAARMEVRAMSTKSSYPANSECRR
jgi:hypothetical protein